MKDKIIEIVLVLLIIIIALVATKCDQDNSKEIQRLKENESQLTKNTKIDTVNHITNVSLLTTKSTKETETLLTDQEKKAIKKVNSKTKRINEITTLLQESKIDTFVKIDTIIRHDTIIPHFRYTDNYCDFAGEIEGDKITFDLKMKDSINIIAHRVPKRLLWGLIKYGTKEIEVDVINTNPYNYIKSAKRVQLVK